MAVLRGAVEPGLVDDALRALHLDLLERGASAPELGEWLWARTGFPTSSTTRESWRWRTRCRPSGLAAGTAVWFFFLIYYYARGGGVNGWRALRPADRLTIRCRGGRCAAGAGGGNRLWTS